jgi:hypothetical protein
VQAGPADLMILVFVGTNGSGATEASLETVTFARELVTRESAGGR